VIVRQANLASGGRSVVQDHSAGPGIIESNEQVTFPPLPRDRYPASGHPLPDLPPHRGLPARHPHRGPDRALPPGPSRNARAHISVASHGHPRRHDRAIITANALTRDGSPRGEFADLFSAHGLGTAVGREPMRVRPFAGRARAGREHGPGRGPPGGGGRPACRTGAACGSGPYSPTHKARGRSPAPKAGLQEARDAGLGLAERLGQVLWSARGWRHLLWWARSWRRLLWSACGWRRRLFWLARGRCRWHPPA
jgi:hypothetical protein